MSFQKKNCSFYSRRIHALPKFADEAYFYTDRVWLRRVEQPNSLKQIILLIFFIIDPYNWQDTINTFMTDQTFPAAVVCFVENKCK
jgi:hypothetical protein